MLKKLALVIGIGSLLACSQEEELPIMYPCLDGSCDAIFEIDPLVSPGVYQDVNSYWHIKYWGPRYFTIKGELDKLNSRYVINNIPLVETQYDSDYWIIFNKIRYKMPVYSVLSWFSDGGYKKPIPIGNLEYTLTDIAKIQPPLNIAGYQIQKNFCWECPYAKSALGTYSKYTYNPRQQFFLDKDMVGDTLKVMVKTTFNTDVGEQVVIEKQFKVIVDK
jgi:hypothetical protein